MNLEHPATTIGAVVTIEHQLSNVLIDFARNLGTDFAIDAILDQLVKRIVDILPITAAGVTLIGSGADPHYVAASSEAARRFEHVQDELDEGPCVEAYRTGVAVLIPDLACDTRFVRFAAAALTEGCAAVFAFPLCHGDVRIGALDLYRDRPGSLPADELSVAQTLADVTAAYLLNARARAAVQDSERLYRSIVETADEGIWIQDLSGLTTFMNPKMAVMLSPRIDKRGAAGVFVESVDMVDQQAEITRRGNGAAGVADQYECQLRRTDGAVFDVHISASPLRNFDGAVTGVLKMVTDMTATKRVLADNAMLELARAQTHRMASLGQLAGGVAHDFNNLLGVILNYASLVDAAVDDPAVEADVREISDAAQRAAVLTRQLLSFARQDVVRPAAVDLRVVLDGFKRVLTSTLGERIELRYEFDPADVIVLADPNQLEQVLLNVAINARDAMPDGGRLTIRTDHVISADGLSWARIQISDTGHGMPVDVAERAFEPFFTTKPRGSGTGLGLATVYGIVTNNGGEISIDSTPGHGAMIEIRLPAHHSGQAVRTDVPPADVSIRGGTETILLVEDQQALRIATARLLTAAGYRVITVTDGDEVMAVLDNADTPVDLVITDIVMQRMSGIELGVELQQHHPALPVLYVSGHPPPNSGSNLRILAKPASPETLLHAISDVLDRATPKTVEVERVAVSRVGHGGRDGSIVVAEEQFGRDGACQVEEIGGEVYEQVVDGNDADELI